MRNRFHLREINWVAYFPATGNQGRKLGDYGVSYYDRVNKKGQRGPRIYLKHALDIPTIKDNYPHNVGWFQESHGKGTNWTPV